MDYKRIFLKEATPTSIGGQAIMEGVMMRGPERTAIAMRLPDGRLYLKTNKRKPDGKWKKLPFIRGVIAFIVSLVDGMGTLLESANILERFLPEEETAEPGRLEKWIESKFGSRALWNFLMATAVMISLVLSIGIFVIFPTVAVNWLRAWITNAVALNLIEGVFRIILFIIYIVLISRMEDIKTLFRYHGSEHKTIHCYENGLELTPENAQTFYTLHPRCGTSFIIFVFIISLLLFSLLGWPNMAMRILSRILLLPVIAGISYELLRWAGRSNSAAVRILSWPGLMMQKLTTAEPTLEQLEVAIVSLKAVLKDPETPEVEGFCDKDANILTEEADEVNEEAAAEEETDEVNEEAAEEETRDGALEPSGDDTVVLPWTELPYNDPQYRDFAEKKAAEEIELKFGDEVVNSETVKLPRSAKSKYLKVDAKRYSDDPDTVENTIKRAQEKLADKPNGRNEAVDLFRYVMGYSRAEIVTHAKELLEQKEIAEYEERIAMRLAGTPMQYITNVQEFMGLPFKVSPEVLIPRLDTEVLAEQVIGLIKGRGLEEIDVLDLCCGSGALGITMAHEFPNAHVDLSDISEGATAVAKQNAGINGVEEQCDFYTGNMFDMLPDGKRYDVVICNPPYIESAVIDTLDTEVKDHEPRLALDGGDDGLKFYRILALESPGRLKSGGILALEIGNRQAKAVSLLLDLSGEFGKARIIKDLNGHDRVILAEKL